MGCAGCLVVQTCLATPFLQTDPKFGKNFSTFWGLLWSVVERRLWRFQMSFSTKMIVHPLLGPKNPFQNQFVEKKWLYRQNQLVEKSMSVASLQLLSCGSRPDNFFYKTWRFTSSTKWFWPFLEKTVKTLHVDWPDSDKHCFLQNIWVHYKIRVCIPLILYKIHREKVICIGHMPPLFRRGNFKGDTLATRIIPKQLVNSRTTCDFVKS